MPSLILHELLDYIRDRRPRMRQSARVEEVRPSWRNGTTQIVIRNLKKEKRQSNKGQCKKIGPTSIAGIAHARQTAKRQTKSVLTACMTSDRRRVERRKDKITWPARTRMYGGTKSKGIDGGVEARTRLCLDRNSKRNRIPLVVGTWERSRPCSSIKLSRRSAQTNT